MNKITLLFLATQLVSCANIQGINELEKGLNNRVGQPYDNYSRGRGNYLSLINKTAEFEEYEFKRPDGCTYAFKVNPESKIIMSWRFTSTREACEKEIYIPGV